MTRLGRLVKERRQRRRERRANKKKLKQMRRGPRRTRLINRQRRVIKRTRYVIGVIERLRRSGAAWAGCRAVTDEVIDFVRREHGIGVSSRKRWGLFGNPDSHHYMGNTTADAVDFLTAENYSLGHSIAKHLGAEGEWDGDYDWYEIELDGKRFRVQQIAGTHGTGPHFHFGVERIFD